MKIPIFQVDAFTDEVFHGNPAAVCLLESWLDEEHMQAIAAENNLSETAFVVGGNGSYEIRWFTPSQEVDLCGHATLASGYIVAHRVESACDEVRFVSASGPLVVRRVGDSMQLDFPSRPPVPCTPPDGMIEALGCSAIETSRSRDHLVLLRSEEEVRAVSPDFYQLGQCDCFGVIVTSPGDSCDFVSRFFAPAVGVPEDPVTGSAHCTLVPFWAERLGKRDLNARQVSRRGGAIRCSLERDRVLLSGKAVLYLEGAINI